VQGNDPQIIWSINGWNDSTSSCDNTKQCRKTATEFASLTYMASPNSSGASIYLDVSFEDTDFDIYFNGEITNIDSFNVDTCTFYSIGHLPSSTSDINITVVITGPVMSGRRQIADWSFEFNGFLIGESSGSGSIPGAANQIKPAGLTAATIATVAGLLAIMSWF
jgi:hypothetical protein